MSSKWSLRLRNWKETVMVIRILEKKPKSMKICDQFGREHELREIDFSPSEWEDIEVGSKIELDIRESIVGTKVILSELPEGFEKEVAH